MKNIFIFLIMLFPVVVMAQFPAQQYNAGPVTWYGIDYSACRMIGAEGFTDPKKIVEVYFNAWNDFVNTEPDKYDIPKYLIKSDIRFDLSLVKERNAGVNPDSLVQTEKYFFSQDELTQIISSLNCKEKSGLGAMLFAEYYSKKDEKASYLLVVFDIESRKVIQLRRYAADPAGFGFRNYWAKTFYSTLQLINKDMKKWLK